ncbi:MAG TPA: hypothetical protein VG962_10670 [Steroidobacteraceae bacterium]|nr:hypothetical protein [Steroidobacteraceae bacterium]
MSDRVRLRLVINKELDDLLEQWAKQGATNKSEILRRAFYLYEVAAQARGKGQHLGIFNADRRVLREIVGI